jgi:hypothetical protein
MTSADTVHEAAGQRILLLADDGQPVGVPPREARDLIEYAMNEQATIVAVPAHRLDPAFFELRTGMAGELLQKMVNYRLKFAVLGDISEHVAASDALRDFVVECNRGRDVFFEPDLEALENRLTALP